MSTVISEAGRTHLRWALTDGVGPLTFARLVERFGDAERALGASASALRELKGVGNERAEQIARSAERVNVDAELEAAATHGVRIICRADADYPPGLQQIPDAPIVLYVRGELRPTDTVAVAIVGSRRCSIYGSEQARRFGELLAGAGFTVVSGLARGIDSFAQYGAVDAGGRSLAVLGCGLDQVYPPENKPLADKVAEQGACVSELPICASVRAENFPSRNRIIAGLTLGTLVIEAAQRSGALITARLAAEYNREVFALPGRAGDATSQGTNALIRDGGAKLTTCLEDILSELGEVGTALCPPQAADPNASNAGASRAGARGASRSAATAGAPAADLFATASLSDQEARVLATLTADPQPQDAVLAALDLPTGDVLAAFTALQLKGLIRRLPGGSFVRVAGSRRS